MMLPYYLFFILKSSPKSDSLSLHDALPISDEATDEPTSEPTTPEPPLTADPQPTETPIRSEEHTSELQSRGHLVCRLLLEKKKKLRYIKKRMKICLYN